MKLTYIPILYYTTTSSTSACCMCKRKQEHDTCRAEAPLFLLFSSGCRMERPCVLSLLLPVYASKLWAISPSAHVGSCRLQWHCLSPAACKWLAHSLLAACLKRSCRAQTLPLPLPYCRSLYSDSPAACRLYLFLPCTSLPGCICRD